MERCHPRRPFLILACLWLPAGGAFTAPWQPTRAAAQAGSWTTWSPRDEIRPVFTQEPMDTS